MKKSIVVLFILSFLLSTIGIIADGDSKEARMTLRFAEFFAMTALIFIVFSAIYFSTKFLTKNLKAKA